MPNGQFPTPSKPYSLKAIVHEIINTPGYGTFIYEQIAKARDGDDDAAALIEAHFRPRRSELKDLKIPTAQWDELLACTERRTHFIDFAHYI